MAFRQGQNGFLLWLPQSQACVFVALSPRTTPGGTIHRVQNKWCASSAAVPCVPCTAVREGPLTDLWAYTEARGDGQAPFTKSNAILLKIWAKQEVGHPSQGLEFMG